MVITVLQSNIGSKYLSRQVFPIVVIILSMVQYLKRGHFGSEERIWSKSELLHFSLCLVCQNLIFAGKLSIGP